jgi:predicted DsbA family dithiol-disulfide isomerase
MRIDFVSDVSCPWCAIGLAALEQALSRLDGEVEAELHFQPFELNPQMAPEGEDTIEHLTRKYGITPEQCERNAEAIRLRGETVGFTFGKGRRRRVYNTFDAHRLLVWAGRQGRALELKRELLQAYHARGENPALPDVLLHAVAAAGRLDDGGAREVLAGAAYADEVRGSVRLWQRRGVDSVPAVVIDRRSLLSGAQSVQVFEQALRRF